MIQKDLPLIIKNNIKKINPDVEITLFGSRARGDTNKYLNQWPIF